jgi:hypothetical protein
VAGEMMQHVKDCYPRSTLYTAILVTMLLVLQVLEMLGVRI